jgi:hypothetical protein
MLQGVYRCHAGSLNSWPTLANDTRTSARASPTFAPRLLTSPNFVNDIARLSSWLVSGRHDTVFAVNSSICGASVFNSVSDGARLTAVGFSARASGRSFAADGRSARSAGVAATENRDSESSPEGSELATGSSDFRVGSSTSSVCRRFANADSIALSVGGS